MTWINEFFLITNLSTFDSNMYLSLNIIKIENVDNKNCSYLCDRTHEYIYIYNQFVVKTYLYLTCNVKLNIQNTKKLIINQHKNDTCHV